MFKSMPALCHQRKQNSSDLKENEDHDEAARGWHVKVQTAWVYLENTEVFILGK